MVQRMREIGVRLALGAHPREVVSMIVRKGLLVAFTGMAVGLAAGIGALSTYLPGRAAVISTPD